jgi:peptidylprolyl isomerase
MADQTLTLTLDSGGDVVIRLRPDLAPGHVERIVSLASEGFYDGVVFHRVIPGFMAQGGDPTGTGMGGSEQPDLKAEFSREPHVRGVCSMARSQNPNSANSQFFICFDDARFLDNQYTVWGEVTSGMEHVDALPKGEPPKTPGQDRQGDRLGSLTAKGGRSRPGVQAGFASTATVLNSQSWNSLTARFDMAERRQTNQ